MSAASDAPTWASALVVGATVLGTALFLSMARAVVRATAKKLKGYTPAECGRITRHALGRCNGMDPNRPIYIAINGKVYDVTPCNAFGPLGVLNGAAGREAAHLLAREPFNEEILGDSYRGLKIRFPPDDSTEGFSMSPHEESTLAAWHAAIRKRCAEVGEVAPPKEFTLEDIKPFTGKRPGDPIYVAVRGTVFDMSRGRMFYGPDGAYESFAGNEIARALAKMSQDPKDFTSNLDGLSQTELGVLKDWEAKFTSKYDVVGKIVG
ncbi:unnamed protein product [Pedinophyceae sp. YPF-701]|nr:unnamed protein product [Pedinophyceae sp. YPF-701]